MSDLWPLLFARILNVNLFGLAVLLTAWLFRRGGRRLHPRQRLMLWWLLAGRILFELGWNGAVPAAVDWAAHPGQLLIGFSFPRLFAFDLTLGSRSISLGEYELDRLGAESAGLMAQVVVGAGVVVALFRLAQLAHFGWLLRRHEMARAEGVVYVEPFAGLPPLFAWGSVVMARSDTPERLTRSQWEAAVAHEKAHCRRRDPILFQALYVLRGLLWFVPPFALAARGICEEAELLCDAEAVANGAEVRNLGQALLSLSEPCHCPQPCLVDSSSVALVRRRIQHLHRPLVADRRSWWATVGAGAWVVGLHFFAG